MSLSRSRISIQDYVSSLPNEVQCFQFYELRGQNDIFLSSMCIIS